MATLRFSQRAEADLLEIGAYTLRRWGEQQVIRYLDEIEACCTMLADNSTLGRAAADIRPGLWRMECGSHVVFYWRETGGILVSRILHRRMMPERHVIGDEEEST